jgi:hypothetical protein
VNRIGIALVVTASLFGGCRQGAGSGGGSGRLDVRWTGTEGGRIARPATAEWCARHKRLEIQAIQGDTGIGVAIYPVDSIVAGEYRVLPPARAESLPPAAGVALRWLSKASVRGFRADTGTVVLERGRAGTLSGSVAARARSVTDTQRVEINGTFQELTVMPQSRGCIPPAAPEGSGAPSADTLD